MDGLSDYRAYLKEELTQRKIMNPLYSLRSFARDLNISPSNLSRVLNKKEGISIDKASKIATKLSLSEKRKSWFISSVGACHTKNPKEKELYEKALSKIESSRDSIPEIELKYFDVIKQWYHFAILELTHVNDFKSCVDWIAKKLQISQPDCSKAIENLKDLKLLEVKNGKYIDKFEYINTSHDIPSLSLKKFHSDLITKANHALIEQPVEDREILSSIMAIDKSQLPLFKEKIRQLKREFEIDVEKDVSPKSAVYSLNINFYELSK